MSGNLFLGLGVLLVCGLVASQGPTVGDLQSIATGKGVNITSNSTTTATGPTPSEPAQNSSKNATEATTPLPSTGAQNATTATPTTTSTSSPTSSSTSTESPSPAKPENVWKVSGNSSSIMFQGTMKLSVQYTNTKNQTSKEVDIPANATASVINDTVNGTLGTSTTLLLAWMELNRTNSLYLTFGITKEKYWLAGVDARIALINETKEMAFWNLTSIKQFETPLNFSYSCTDLKTNTIVDSKHKEDNIKFENFQFKIFPVKDAKYEFGEKSSCLADNVGGLGGWGIFGIVMLVLVLVGGLMGGLYWYLNKAKAASRSYQNM